MSLPSSCLVVPSHLAAPTSRLPSRYVVRHGANRHVFLTVYQVPEAYYVANTGYAVVLDVTYPINGPNGMLYLVVGSVEAPITINV